MGLVGAGAFNRRVTLGNTTVQLMTLFLIINQHGFNGARLQATDKVGLLHERFLYTVHDLELELDPTEL